MNIDQMLTRVVCADFETFYDSKSYSLKRPEWTTTKYIRAPQFKAHGVALRTWRMKKAQWYTGQAMVRALGRIDWGRVSMLCHHAHFDGLVGSHHFNIRPQYYLDTLSMARGLFRGPLETRSDLDTVAKLLGMGGKHESYLDAVNGVRDPPAKDLKLLGVGAAIDCDLTWDIFWTLLNEYEFPQEELPLIHHTVKCYADPIVQVDKVVATRAHNRELRRRKQVFRRVHLALGGEGRLIPRKREALMTKVRSRKQFPEVLRAHGVKPPTKVSPTWLKKTRTEREAAPEKKFTFAFAKTDNQFVELLQHPNPVIRDLVEAKLLVNSSIYETRPKLMLEHADPALPLYLSMYGAHTTRHTGGDSMNPLNLGKEGDLRRAVIPPPGHVFVIVDSGQIECRFNAWMAGQWDLIEQFIEYDKGNPAADPYCVQAADIFGHKVTKDDTLERFVGKTCVLGMGYQMSAYKYQLQLESGALGPRTVLPPEMYLSAVKAYRGRNPHIVKQWYAFDDLIPHMCRPGFVHRYRGDLLSFEHEAIYGPTLGLHYPRLREARREEMTPEEEERADMHPHRSQYIYREHAKLYGGKVTENVVQYLCRLIVMEQVMRVAEYFRTVLMVYDEGVWCVPKRQARRCLNMAIESFNTPPSWCADLPTKGEGGIFDHYTKM